MDKQFLLHILTMAYLLFMEFIKDKHIQKNHTMKRFYFTTIVLLVTICINATGWVWDVNLMYSHAKDPTVADAVAGIIRDADKQLLNPCPTVMDKQAVAPSGDKHDYYSMARYWWPNPETDNGLPYVRRDGKVNSETKDLDRENLGSFEKMLRVYALAYFSFIFSASVSSIWREAMSLVMLLEPKGMTAKWRRTFFE
jgi:hypothetical protein